jgi:hypothetical protein
MKTTEVEQWAERGSSAATRQGRDVPLSGLVDGQRIHRVIGKESDQNGHFWSRLDKKYPKKNKKASRELPRSLAFFENGRKKSAEDRN